MTVRVSVEQRRGCGYRQEGGLYLMGGILESPCGKIPLRLHVCRACGQGFKQARSWSWIEPRELFDAKPCALALTGRARCEICPAGPGMPERAGLLWIGAKHYPTPNEFIHEAKRLGVSKRIASVPRGIELGSTQVFLAHPRGDRDPCMDCATTGTTHEPASDAVLPPCETCHGEGYHYYSAVVAVFTALRLEKVVHSGYSEEELEKLRKRDIEPVIVQRDTDQKENGATQDAAF